jgi:hypothetical protein
VLTPVAAEDGWQLGDAAKPTVDQTAQSSTYGINCSGSFDTTQSYCPYLAAPSCDRAIVSGMNHSKQAKLHQLALFISAAQCAVEGAINRAGSQRCGAFTWVSSMWCAGACAQQFTGNTVALPSDSATLNLGTRPAPT